MSQLPFLTIVMGIRNRAGERLERCLSSLQAQTFQEFRVILVDYGSDLEQAFMTRQIVERFPFCRYIYSETRGYPWNRSRALNIGGRMAESPYLMTTDVDMLFPKKFLEIALGRAGEQKVLHCRPVFLSRTFHDWVNFERFPGVAAPGNGFLGGCQIVPTTIFQSMRGFDEVFEYWGAEDRDLNQRLRRLNVEMEWINDWTVIYHQWHPSVNYHVIGSMPDGFWGRVNTYYHLMLNQTTRNSSDWGRIHTLEDRPVFAFLDLPSNDLRERDDISIFDSPPDTNHEVGRMLDVFFALPAGHALAVMHAAYPRRSSASERLFVMVNALLNRTRAGFRVGYTPNFIHSFISDFIEQNPSLLSDYYLNFPVADGATILMRRG